MFSIIPAPPRGSGPPPVNIPADARDHVHCWARSSEKPVAAFGILLQTAWRRRSVANHIVCIGFDFDMPPELIGPDGALPLSFGEARSAALGCLMALLRSRGVHTTWFIPAATIEACRRECAPVVENEIGRA